MLGNKMFMHLVVMMKYSNYL